MRYRIIILLCLLCQSVFGVGTALKDSLLQQLANATDSQHKAQIYRNLADLYFDCPQEQHYLKLLIKQAKQQDNQALLLDGYGDLAYSYIKAGQSDSAKHQMDAIKQMPSTDATSSRLTYLNMRLFDSEVVKGSGVDAITEELKKQSDAKNKNKTIYIQIEYAYKVASGLETLKKYRDALVYVQTAVDLAATLPFKEGGILYVATLRLKQRILRLDNQSDLLVPLIEKYTQLQDNHYERYLKESRPFYPIDAMRIADYSALIINIRKLTPQQANFYLQKIMDLGSKTDRPKDKYYCFLSINNYYLFKKDYPKALASNDSLLKYAPIVAPYLMSYLYSVNSQIYEAMGQYKEALKAIRTSHAMQDSINTTQSAEQLNQLQVQYDLNKLNYEKSQLEINNKQIMLISLSIILLISIVVSAYLYYNLKKEKRLKARLRVFQIKAEESESLKKTFINSICHEIRTPLNSIVGFTDLLFDESIDAELRETFPAEVQKNTQLLTGLIDSILEVANLDVSDEKLPCEPTDIGSICHNEIDRIKILGKSELNFQLDIPQEPLTISTNPQYLALVIENLLNNANKFTTSGSVTLEYHVDKSTDCLRISITDTGCGIPPEKHEAVFDRFTKLNSFIPGNGLGLYLCRLIVKRLSGEIAIDGKYEGGTRVVVSLPIQ